MLCNVKIRLLTDGNVDVCIFCSHSGNFKMPTHSAVSVYYDVSSHKSSNFVKQHSSWPKCNEQTALFWSEHTQMSTINMYLRTTTIISSSSIKF